MKLADFSPDAHNANQGSARGQKAIVNSVQRSGAGRSLLADKDNRIIAGNKSLEAMAEVFGPDVEPIIVESDGTRPVIVKRTDLDLEDPNPNSPARQLAYADNLTSWASFTPDLEVFAADLEAGFDFEAIDISVGDLGELLANRGVNMRFLPFDGDGDGGGSQVMSGERVRVVIGPKIFDIEDKNHTLYRAIDRKEDSNLKAMVLDMLSKL